MLEAREFQAEDLQHLVPLRGAFEVNDVEDGLKLAKQRGYTPVRSVLVSGEVAAVLGVTISGSVGEIFSYLGEPICRFPLAVTKQVRRELKAIEEMYRLKRTHIFVDTTNYRAVRWAKALGFEVESMMRKLGPQGEDFIVFARFPNG